MLTPAVGLASPTHAASVTSAVFSTGLASRYTATLTCKFWEVTCVCQADGAFTVGNEVDGRHLAPVARHGSIEPHQNVGIVDRTGGQQIEGTAGCDPAGGAIGAGIELFRKAVIRHVVLDRQSLACHRGADADVAEVDGLRSLKHRVGQPVHTALDVGDDVHILGGRAECPSR